MKFKIDVYSTTITLHLHSLEECEIKYKKLKKKLSLPDEGEGLFHGMVFLEPNNQLKGHIILATEHLSHNLITHECVHLATRIFLFNNIELRMEEDENFALLVAYIAEKVYDILNKKQLMLYKQTPA